jgi:hypothetical protein
VIHRDSVRLHSPVELLCKHLGGACAMAAGLSRPVPASWTCMGLGSVAFRLDQGRRDACRL